MRNQETEFCYTCSTSSFLGTSMKNLLFSIIVHRLIQMLPKLTRMWKWRYKTIPFLCLFCFEHIIIYAKIQKSIKFGQQGETQSCMQEYNLGDFSKFYPQNIFKMVLNLYFGPKLASHAIGFRGFFKKTCYYMTNPPWPPRCSFGCWFPS